MNRKQLLLRKTLGSFEVIEEFLDLTLTPKCGCHLIRQLDDSLKRISEPPLPFVLNELRSKMLRNLHDGEAMSV